ncbi:MAG: hypothetical protein SV377_04115 [Halobacteria archaeon]|nr:hypothetical protein [Halobacteria archaeon]
MEISKCVYSVTLILLIFISATVSGFAVQDTKTSGVLGPSQPGTYQSVEENTTNTTVVYELRLIPQRPGVINVTVHVPVENGTRTEVNLFSFQKVVESHGFVQNASKKWAWDGKTPDPWLAYEVPVNESNARFEGRESIDVGSWALINPSKIYAGVSTEKQRYDERIKVSQGFVGEFLVYIGPRSLHNRTAHGQEFRLVVPDYAQMSKKPSEILSSLERASGLLAIGDRDSEVNVFVAPPPIRRGGRAYLNEFWVSDIARLNSSENLWIHEYVHTRQVFLPGPRMVWFKEASADYYASLLTWKEGRISFEEFREGITTRRYADAVLSQPNEWSSPQVPYEKGPLVLGALDAKIRMSTGGNYTLQDVFLRMNGRFVTYDDFQKIVEGVAGKSLDDWLDRYVLTSASPSLPSNSTIYSKVGTGTEFSGRVEFKLRERWVSNPEIVPAGIPIEARFKGQRSGKLEAGKNSSLIGNNTLVFDGNETATVVVRPYYDTPERLERKVNTSDDVDNDGLRNVYEVSLGTGVWENDSDSDGLQDGEEVNRYNTDPLDNDSDGDGIPDDRDVREQEKNETDNQDNNSDNTTGSSGKTDSQSERENESTGERNKSQEEGDIDRAIEPSGGLYLGAIALLILVAVIALRRLMR